MAGFVLLGAMASLLEQAGGQQSAPAAGVPVKMVVTAEARHGTNPAAVNREDVMVYEGNTRDQVTSWERAEGEHGARELFVLLHDSAAATLGAQFADLRQFINSQPAATKVAVAYMQNGSAKIAENLSGDHLQAAKSLRLPLGVPGINASPYLSLSDLIKHWPASEARREVLMVSDGINRYYGRGDLEDPYLSEAIEKAQKAGIVVFAIYNPGAGHLGHSYWRTYWGQIFPPSPIALAASPMTSGSAVQR